MGCLRAATQPVWTARSTGDYSRMDLAEQFNAAPLPFANLMGLEVVEATPEKVRVRVTVREELCTSGGILHGGAVMALADTAGAIGGFLNLPEGTRTTTTDSKTNFLSAAPVGTVVTAEATPLKIGKRLSVWRTKVTDESGKLLAFVVQTQMVV